MNFDRRRKPYRYRKVNCYRFPKVNRNAVATAVSANLPWTRQGILDIRCGQAALRFVTTGAVREIKYH